MRTRLLKEFRQLLPAWIAAMLTLLAAILFNARSEIREAYALGLVLLAVAAFGREFSQHTFVGLLAQPISRERIWWEKIAVLLCAMLSFALAFCSAWKALLQHPVLLLGDFPGWGYCAFLAGLVFASGLLGSLLLRQFIGAAVFAVVVPYALGASTMMVLPKPSWALAGGVVLGVYAIAAFLLARRLFVRAEDYHALGRSLELADLRAWRRIGAMELPRKGARPMRVLIWKEVQFQQIGFVFAAVLAALYVLALISNKVVKAEPGSTLQLLLEGFPFLWLGLPFFAGCSAVSEERRLGTLEPQLCLPMHRGTQFLLKLLVTLACGVLLGGCLPWLIGFCARQVGLEIPNMHQPGGGGLWALCVSCLGVTLIAFYASTLSRHMLQSVGLALGFGAAIGLFIAMLRSQFSSSLGPLMIDLMIPIALVASLICLRIRIRWLLMALAGTVGLVCLLALMPGARGSALLLFERMCLASSATGFPLFGSLGLLGLALAYRNFRRVHVGFGMWGWNVAAWGGTWLAVMVITPFVYIRAWEAFLPAEPAHGPARLSQSTPPKLVSGANRVVVLLRDGRLWMGLRSTERVKQIGISTYAFGSMRLKSGFIAGTDWVDAAVWFDGCAAIRSDGSLWDLSTTVPGKGETAMQRIGNDSDWKSVAAGTAHFLALKTDGTLWGVGYLASELTASKSKAHIETPMRIGTESNWTSIYAGASGSIAAKADGTVWRWGTWLLITNRSWRPHTYVQPVLWEGFPPESIVAISASDYSGAMVFADGSLWGVLPTWRNPRARTADEVVRLSDALDWKDAGMTFDQVRIAAIKRDGSLWNIPRTLGVFDRSERYRDFRRLSQHSDWLAVSPFDVSLLALSADGSLWLWQNPARPMGLLAASRRPQKLANLFE